jgi:hypothetical protein
MKRCIFFLLLFISSSCRKEDCTGATFLLKQNVIYTAKTAGRVSASINGCSGVYIWVNCCWKAASSNDRNAEISTTVAKGDKWRVSSQCSDIGITVKFEEICN